MPFGFHGLDLVVILVIALLIFGPKKLPEMGAAIGKSIKEFQKGMKEITSPKEEEETKAPSALSMEAIDREIASKKAAASQASSVAPEPEVYSSSVGDVEAPRE
jgi:sec-independent protein translocase protein TatA